MWSLGRRVNGRKLVERKEIKTIGFITKWRLIYSPLSIYVIYSGSLESKESQSWGHKNVNICVLISDLLYVYLGNNTWLKMWSLAVFCLIFYNQTIKWLTRRAVKFLFIQFDFTKLKIILVSSGINVP